MKNVIIYTDGACSGNPGVGAWAAVLIYKEVEREASGSNPDTTNNIMELTAAVEALKLLKESCNVELYSDSAYLINAFEKGWLYKWELNNWKTSSKEPVKNKELWEELLKLNKEHKIRWIKVKGHSDNEYNSRCDQMARDKIKEYNELTK